MVARKRSRWCGRRFGKILKMPEKYQDETIGGLLKLYVEARESGMESLADECWNRIRSKDRHDTDIKLKQLRREINGILTSESKGNRET